MEYKINDQLFSALLKYISSRPVAEVYNIFNALLKIKNEQDEINKMSQEMKQG